MRRFCWLSARPIPADFDLRRLGWQLTPAKPRDTAGCPALVLPAPAAAENWPGLLRSAPVAPGLVAVLGIDDPAERADLLRLGFGEALAWDTSLAELDLRLRRIDDRQRLLPPLRALGSLRLDLVARDGWVAGRRLGLHPREFALLWRLADAPGEPVAAARLLADVWRLSFRPPTNSLAVHVSRLRAKLRVAGLDGLVETLPGGAYRLVATAPAGAGDARPLHLSLDGLRSLGKEQPAKQPAERIPCATK